MLRRILCYCRRHGAEVLYASGYDAKSIADWARRAVDWAQGREPEDAQRVIERPGPKRAARDVSVYFDNDTKVRAPADALAMEKAVQRRLKVEHRKKESRQDAGL